MPSPIRSVALVTVAALSAAVLVAPLAVADGYIQMDPAGDMTVQDPETGEITPAPTHRTLDIRRAFVRYTDQVVKVRVVMRALTRPQGDEGFHVGGYLRVNRQAQPVRNERRVAWQWDVYFDEHHGRQGYGMWVIDSGYQETYGCDGRDDGINATAHYNGNWVTVTIPRRCLTVVYDYPRVPPSWVRASVRTEHGLGADRPMYGDRLPVTPRLYPG